jgi:polysaccharide export outer membrane protein
MLSLLSKFIRHRRNAKPKSFVRNVSFVLILSGIISGQAPSGTAQAAQAAPTRLTSGPETAAPVEKKLQDDNYVIGNDDQLEINVWKEPELTQSIPVRSDGKISLPLIGEVLVTGRTPLQVKEEIASRLRQYLTAPDVTVMVLQMNSQKFNILGRVIKPGSFPLLATTTVLDAIAEAGGFQDFAKQKSIYILRRNSQGVETRLTFNYKDVIQGKHPEQNIRVKPNDTIVVP